MEPCISDTSLASAVSSGEYASVVLFSNGIHLQWCLGIPNLVLGVYKSSSILCINNTLELAM